MIRVLQFRKIVTTMVAVALICESAESAGSAVQWLTGREFQQRLTLPATVLWADSPFRDYLVDFGRVQRVAILVDRRVDPDRPLTLAVRDEPVVAIVRAAAESQDLQAAVLPNVLFVGPAASASRIRTVAELRRQDVEALGKDAIRKFVVQAPMVWEDLDSPRNLLGRLADENGLEIVNLQQVPHDLWPGGQLPPLSIIERLTLILHQFDLTFQVAEDCRRVAVVPLPRDVAVVRDYAGGSKPEVLVEKWRTACPDCEFRVAGGRVYVRGLMEDHETIVAMQTGGVRPSTRSRERGDSAPPLERVFTADVPNRPLGAVLSHFCKQLGLELQIDRTSLQAAGVSLDQLISLRVENATFEELFQAALGPTGCSFERKGDVLRVWAKQ